MSSRLEALNDALRTVIDPELGLDIVSLGLIYELSAGEDGAVMVRMTMTSRGCPMQGLITACARSALEALPDVGPVTIEVVWEPAWTPERISPEGQRQLAL